MMRRRIDEIVEAAAAMYEVSAEEIYGYARTKSLTQARQCIYFVARGSTRMSFSEIGAALNRDHTTVMACAQSARRLMARDPWFKSATQSLLERFSPGGPS